MESLRNHCGASIALMDPKYPHNVGAVLRAASCYAASGVAFNGQRVIDRIIQDKRIPREERLRGYKHVGLYHSQDPTYFSSK